MSDEHNNDEHGQPAHNNPAIERFKKGGGKHTGVEPGSENALPQSRAQTHDQEHIDTEPSLGPVYDDDDATGPAPSDKDAASRQDKGRPLFYDNPVDAENSRKGSSAASMFDRMKSTIKQHTGDGQAGGENVFQRLAARGKAKAQGKAVGTSAKAEDEQPAAVEIPVEAQSSRQARKQRKARDKQRKARHSQQDSSVSKDQNSQTAKSTRKLPRAVAAVALVGLCGVVAYKAGYTPPFVDTLLEGHTKALVAQNTQSPDKTPTQPASDSPDGFSVSDNNALPDEQLPRLADSDVPESMDFQDNASFGGEGLPSIDDTDFSNTPDGVQEEVALLMDEPIQDSDLEPVLDLSGIPAAASDPFFLQTQAEAQSDGDDDAAAGSDAVVASTAQDDDSASQTVAANDTAATTPVMPEAVSPHAVDIPGEDSDDNSDDLPVETQTAGAAVDDEAIPEAPATMADRLQAIEHKLAASERKFAKLQASGSPRTKAARVTSAKPNIKLLGISIARYCSNCVPLVTILEHGETRHLSEGDTFHGYRVRIKGDRLLLVRGSVQHSYYPTS